MRLALPLLAVLALASPCFAQDPDEAKRDALIAQDWFKKGHWTSKLEDAKAEARKTGKVIYVYYVTTDEAPYCRDIEKSLFSDEKFQEWAKKFVCYCQITWSKEKCTLEELHHAHGKAWPWFSFLDGTGGLILPLRPMKALKGFEEAGERVLNYVELSKRVQKGGDPEKRDLVIAALDLGKLKAEDAHARLAKLGDLTDEQKKALAQAETNAFVSNISIETDPANKEAVLAAGRKFLEHKNSGKPLPSSRGDFQAYWIAILKVAAADKDAALYEEGYLALKERYGQEPSTKGFFESCAKTLEELKASKK